MATIHADRVKEVTTTTGTGSYALGGAYAGFQTFNVGIGNGNTAYYCATDGIEWEVGLGTFTAPSTFARTTVLHSSNAGAAVNWGTGNKTIFTTATADVITNIESAASALDARVTTLEGLGGGILQQRSFTPVVFDPNNATDSIAHEPYLNAAGTDMIFSADGLSVYATSSGWGKAYIYQYTLGTAWTISTVDYTTVKYFSTDAQTTYLSGMFIAGGFLYVNSLGKFYQYAMTNGNDITAAIYTGVSIDLSGAFSGGTSTGFYINSTGTELYIGDSTSNKVKKFAFSAAWNIATVYYTGVSLDVSATLKGIRSIRFDSTGTKMYIGAQNLSNAYRVFQYTLGTAWNITTAGTAYEFIPGGSPYVQGIEWDSTGTTLFIFSGTALIPYTPTTAWDLSTSVTTGSTTSLSYNNNRVSLEYNSTGTTLLCSETHASAGKIIQYTLSTAWDVTTATYAKEYATGVATGKMTVSADGLKMYVVSGSTLREYTLASAWDITTPTYVTSYTFATPALTSPSVTFKPDGTKLYASNGTVIYQYSLSTAWDVTTITYDTVSYTITGMTGTAEAFRLNAAGTKMIIAASTYMFTYDLGIAWDISSATFNSMCGYIHALQAIRGMWISSDEKTIFTANPGSFAKATMVGAGSYMGAVLTTDGLTPTSTNVLKFDLNSSYIVTIDVTAREATTYTNNYKAWRFEFTEEIDADTWSNYFSTDPVKTVLVDGSIDTSHWDCDLDKDANSWTAVLIRGLASTITTNPVIWSAAIRYTKVVM